jgi:hypothetical protein
VLAAGALCGVPVRRIVEGDEVEAVLWARVTERAAKLQVQMMRAQAGFIAERFK